MPSGSNAIDVLMAWLKTVICQCRIKLFGRLFDESDVFDSFLIPQFYFDDPLSRGGSKHPRQESVLLR